MAKQPESHYEITTLHKIFAGVTILLLLALIGLFAKDYSREWKDYQRRFRALEIEKTRVKLDRASNELKKNPEYEAVQNELAEAQKNLDTKTAEIEKLNDEIERLEDDRDIVTQKFQFSKAEYDAVKYHYEEAHHANPQGTAKIKARLDQLDADVRKFRLQTENIQKELEQRRALLKEYEGEIWALEKKRNQIGQQVMLLEKKLSRIDPGHMTFANQIAELVRDLPVIDLANPNYKIKQIVLKDITDDVNIMRVPKVDRCITCHLGIDNPDFVKAPQPFTTHPNLEVFMGKDSAHPLEEFACTTCHLGRGRGTSFNATAHTPSNEEEAKEWEKKYKWHPLHHWEEPMLPTQFTQASCFKCHSGQTVIKDAEKLNLGMNLIEKAGCYGCHAIEKYEDWPRPGPTLRHLASKTTKDWAYRWILSPQSIRPDTWMPAYFGLSNNSDPESIKRGHQEIHAMVHYLFKHSTPYQVETMEQWGDPKSGKELVQSLGCFGCHQMEYDKKDEPTTRAGLRREHGPNLIGLGSKTNKAWLYSWLKDPKRYHPNTRMPNFRLSDKEALDIASYLASDQTKPEQLLAVPPMDEQIINTIVYDFLVKSTMVEEAKAQVAKMSVDEKLEFAGKRLIRHYGCFGCHDIEGFENEKKIGADLNQEGGKTAHDFDFGFVHIPHTKEAWLAQKVRDPRIFDQGRIKNPQEKLIMPNFYMNEDEIAAVTTALLGFVKDRPDESKMMNRSPEQIFIEEGAEIIRQFNCQGCHVIEGEGGDIQPVITEWLVEYKGYDPADAQAVTLGFSPPNLLGEGKKVQTAWLFEFIHSPEIIRPWLTVRMPTYDMATARQLNSMVKYFSYLDDQEFPFADVHKSTLKPEEFEAAAKLFSKDYFDCASCHIVGDQMPAGTPDRWAPDFALAKRRLKPEWIAEWLRDPQALMPGTKMPTYYDPAYYDTAGPEDIMGGNENLQIKALRDYILTLAPEGNAAPKKNGNGKTGNGTVAPEATPETQEDKKPAEEQATEQK